MHPVPLLACVLSIVVPAAAHGRLTVPQSRQARNQVAEYLQNEPVTGGLTSSAFVCRDQPDPDAPHVDVAAGGSFDITWTFTAAHVGDCFLYVSYDLDVDDPQQREWFKISNLVAEEDPPKDCNVNNNVPTTVSLPDWLPGGRAVFRWEWYALHQRDGGNIEYYDQCFDVQVTNPSSSSTYADVRQSISPLFTIGAHLPAAAADYRSGFSPACADDLRTCGGKDRAGALGDDFLVGPDVATYSGPNPGGGGDDDDDSAGAHATCAAVAAAAAACLNFMARM